MVFFKLFGFRIFVCSFQEDGIKVWYSSMNFAVLVYFRKTLKVLLDRYQR